MTKLVRWASATLLGLASCFAMTGPAAAQALTEDAVAQRIASDFGVQVLRVSRADADGRAAYIVTVMNTGGDFNEAFQVTRLMVDATTGKLIPAFRHGPSGYRRSDGPTELPSAGGADIRRRSLRQ